MRITMRVKKQPQLGISLLEVLAAIFVVSIGLLGVLAVIPFGAYQVSKANHAEYAANMLTNAAEEILIREMAKLPTGDSTKFVWFEPYEINDPDNHIARFSEDGWQEIMRGQDDLEYTTYDNKRPDFEGKNGIKSSGKYTWFFTFLPAADEVAVDVLACYNRMLDDDRQVSCSFAASAGGGTFTLFDASHLEVLTQTKYVFVTWETSEVNGAWCKIVFVDKNQSDPKIIVTGELYDAPQDVQVYIPSGVLYHKRLENVAIN